MNDSARPRPALRDSVAGDLPTIATIYAHHVRHGLGSFEETPPDMAEMARRRADILGRKLPYIIAEAGGRIVGYAYAGPYRTRAGYRYTVEDSIYIVHDAQRIGVGRTLLAELLARCTAQGYRQMVAVIGDSANFGSIRAHTALGFMQVALLPAVGFKFGRWVDSVIMQRALGDGQNTVPAAPPGP
ncbi:MAG: N-acetyltransferase [Rhodospirillales bacterium]|nr:N-acetyltransferase [Rhodospirillales bacterium]